MSLNCCFILFYFSLDELLGDFIWLAGFLGELFFQQSDFDLQRTQRSQFLQKL